MCSWWSPTSTMWPGAGNSRRSSAVATPWYVAPASRTTTIVTVAPMRMRRTRRFMSGFGFGEAVLLDPRVELRARQAEELGRAGLVVPRLRERPHDERAFDVLEIHAAGRQGRHR